MIYHPWYLAARQEALRANFAALNQTLYSEVQGFIIFYQKSDDKAYFDPLVKKPKSTKLNYCSGIKPKISTSSKPMKKALKVP